MAGYGQNPYPRRYGGGQRILFAEHMALLDRLAPGWDTSEDSANYAELFAYAVAISVTWAINARVRRCLIPAGMMRSTVATWETAMRLRPARNATLTARRAAIAARFRGIAGNTIYDIEQTASTLLGSRFVALHTIAEADTTTYWPGINPGPPGSRSSNRCTFAIEITEAGITDAERTALIGRLFAELESIAPAWMSFAVGTGEPFIAGLAITGLTFL